MRSWAWVWNAGRRTLRGAHPSFASPDDAWAEERLSHPERSLFHQMDPRERDHGIRVARTMLRAHPEAASEVVAAALLHDVGKSRRSYNVLERVLVHLARTPAPAPEPELDGWRGALQVAAHHPDYGAAMLRAIGARERVAELVARHEKPGDDVEARWIHDADRRT